MNYLVIGSEGPQMSSSEEAIQVLDKFVLPSFEVLMKFEKEGKIHGGLPVGERAVAFIMEAPNNEVVDQFIRRLPIWGILKWKVTALQSFSGRASQEREILEQLKKVKR